MKRASGVLLHISSLPNQFGIGTFGKSAYRFVDFLKETKQSYWQILPLTTTGHGDSPYSSYSAFGGNSHFIDFDILKNNQLLKESDYADINFGDNPDKVDYDLVNEIRRPILEKAVKNFISRAKFSAFEVFYKDNKEWLQPFAEFMTIKEYYNDQPWYEWDNKLKFRDEATLNLFLDEREDVVNYHKITQYIFFEQWNALKTYANNNGIEIIGDLPIYVARNSVEMWATPHLFKIDEDHNPTTVAGVPPDDYSDEGQYWGNPIYDWEYMKNHNYEWWIQRMEHSLKLYDIIRIDHFRGFESYWEIPFGAESAADGKWTLGPGIDLFKQFDQELEGLHFIAEDLGFITQEVIELLQATGFPGLRVIQFGFTGETDTTDLPHNYIANTVAYVGTHDNDTARGWYENATNQAQRDQLDTYLNRRSGEPISKALLRGIASSVSNTAIYTMQDLLNLGSESRMNTPGTVGGNWDWRMRPEAITIDLIESLLLLTQTYYR